MTAMATATVTATVTTTTESITRTPPAAWDGGARVGVGLFARFNPRTLASACRLRGLCVALGCDRISNRQELGRDGAHESVGEDLTDGVDIGQRPRDEMR